MSYPQADKTPHRGSLRRLQLRGIGPAHDITLHTAERINLITGDNGLGKTFLLECAWWALSGSWAGMPAYPRPDAEKGDPQIAYQIAGESGPPESQTIHYDWKQQAWPGHETLNIIPGLLIYARADGAFAVWDPIRNRTPVADSDAFIFTREAVWEGLKKETAGKTAHVCNGLIYDWTIWQNDPTTYPFDTLKRVLRRLSPPDLGVLEPGRPTRIPGGESRPMPTIRHAYGEVPLVYASAAVRRIIALAYLIVWTWSEHQAQAALAREQPQRKLVILIDEIEAHLHPQWQRAIFPALLAIQEDLETALDIQWLVTTHAPLVLASVEPHFDPRRDRLFLFELDRQQSVQFSAAPWSKQGDIVNWLTSETFGLQQARSKEAEMAIEAAESWMRQAAMSSYPDSLRTEEDIHAALRAVLPDHDPFWPRWLVTMERIPGLSRRESV